MRPAVFKRTLNALTVQRVKAGQRAYLIWDTLQRGLVLRVQPTGRQAYYVVYRAHGRPRWLHLGDAAVLPLSDARELAGEALLAVLKGMDPAAEKKAARGAVTFAVLAQRYVEEHAKRKNKSWRQAEYLVRRHVLPVWSDLSAEAIKRSDVRALLGKIEGASLSNQVLASVSAIFTWAVNQELLGNNPCRGVERHAKVSRERVLSDAEVKVFWQVFAEAGIAGTALQILLLTGQRPGEVAHMRWEHVEGGWWTMPGKPDGHGWPGLKNKQTHRIWLPAPVREILAQLGNEETGFVFGRPPRLAVAMRGLKMASTRQFERVTPHDLRRTHGSTITAFGFGRDAMNRIQNHREGGIADVYDRHEYAEENKRIMEAVAAKLMALALGKTVRSNVVRMQP
jgi:integrase